MRHTSKAQLKRIELKRHQCVFILKERFLELKEPIL